MSSSTKCVAIHTFYKKLIYKKLQFVIIFGTRTVTPSIKQLTVYTEFYIDKARSDGEPVGQKITYKHFSNGMVEFKHKESKQGNFVLSGGRQEPKRKHEYQQKILRQKFLSEFIRIENNRKIIETHSSRQGNVCRKLTFDEETKLS